MSAPDYTSLVRAVVNDVRQNYLQKQELFQRQQEAEANRALQYAQLDAQAENARRSADLQDKQLEFNYFQEGIRGAQAKEKLEADAKKTQYELYKDALNQDLAERKQRLDEFSAIRDAQKDSQKLFSQQTSAARLAEFASLASNQDYDGMKNWMVDALSDTRYAIDTGNMISQAIQISSGIDKINGANSVELARPQIEAFSNEVNTLRLNPENYSREGLTKKIQELRSQGISLLGTVKDNTMRETINGTIKGLDGLLSDFDERKSKSTSSRFDQLGRDNALGGVFQQRYDALYTQTPEGERNSEEFQKAKRRIMLDYNQDQARQEAVRYARLGAQYEFNQLQNPSYTITEGDKKYPKFSAPDFTNLSRGARGSSLDIDGNLSDEKLAEWKKFEDQMRSSGIAAPKMDDRQFMLTYEAIRQGKSPVTGQLTPDSKPGTFMFSNQALLEPAILAEASAGSYPKTGFGGQFSPSTTKPASPTSAPPVETKTAPESTSDLVRNKALLEELKRQKAIGNRFFQVYTTNPSDPSKKVWVDWINPSSKKPVSIDYMIQRVESATTSAFGPTGSPIPEETLKETLNLPGEVPGENPFQPK